MKKANKLLVAAGAAVIGLSMIPMASYAEVVTKSATRNVTATVGSSLTITTSGGTVSDNIIPGQSGGTTIGVTVKTNTTRGFTVTVTGGSLTSGANSIAADTTADAGVEGWYIKNASNVAIAPSATAATIWEHTAPSGNTSAINESRSFQVVVGTTEDTPTGTYQGTLTFTAATLE